MPADAAAATAVPTSPSAAAPTGPAAPAADAAPGRGPSLTRRIAAPLLALLAAAFAVTAWLTWREVRHELDELLDAHLAQAAALLVAQHAHDRAALHADAPVGPTPAPGATALPAPAFVPERNLDTPRAHRYSPRVAIQVFHDGRLLLRSTNAPDGPMLPLTRAAPLRRGGSSEPLIDAEDDPPGAAEGDRDGYHDLRLQGRPWRVLAVRDEPTGLVVQVGEQASARREIAGAVLRALALPALVLLPLAALAVAWSVRRGLAPLRAVGAELAAREPASRAPLRSGTDAPREVRPLLHALHGLFARIDAMVDAERRFTADAAHELRTPIAAIRAQAQVARHAGADGAARERALGATIAGCDRAARLVDQLLLLARLDAAVPPSSPAAAAADLAAVARDVLADLALAALARGQSLELDTGGRHDPDTGAGIDADAPIPLAADPVLAGALLRNLVDNAIRYSPDGAPVRVTARRTDGGGAWLAVEDGGPGVADADAARLGQRFFRADRAAAVAAPGSGLGWSIVRRIAEVQHARIDTGRSAALGGWRVVVTWPPSPRSSAATGPARVG